MRRDDILPAAILIGGSLSGLAGAAAIVYVLAAPIVAWGAAGDGIDNHDAATFNRADPGNRLPGTTITKTSYTIGQPSVAIIRSCDSSGRCGIAVGYNDPPPGEGPGYAEAGNDNNSATNAGGCICANHMSVGGAGVY